MDTAKLKKFAPLARRSLIDQVATKLGRVLLEDSPERRERPDAVARLETEIATRTEAAVIDQVAYTWFNRFCALRFMDVHRYTPLGTVSPAEGATLPEILMDAKEGVIDKKWDVDREQAMSLLDGTLPAKDPQAEAYTRLLIAVCNYYHEMMPFLFERISDYTELLVPDDLLSERSILAAMREALPSEACESVEVIGWLYQFYISEKKDEVICKVVKSEDIPAATQLFTPKWIVKYMVQNSLGAHWLATYPDSPLKAQMEFYIEPAEQTDEVNAQRAAITPEQLDPENLTLIDPACGSGHILVEAYDLFKSIYLERGYQQKDVPQLILENNLFGLDIDERAAQLTGLALMMKGRADDRRLFERGVKLNVMAMVDSAEFDVEGLAHAVELSGHGLEPGDLKDLKELFENATTFGSLIQVPEGFAEKLPKLEKLSETRSDELYAADALKRLGPLVHLAKLLAAKYSAVVANPPYMGRKGMNALVKEFLKNFYLAAQNDLYAAFMTRSRSFLQPLGLAGFITRQDWMFTARNQPFRENLLDTCALRSLVHIGPNTFPELSGEIVQGTSTVFWGCSVPGIATTFVDATAPDTDEKLKSFKAVSHRFFKKQEAFSRLPGRPLAYWVTKGTIEAFARPSVETVSISDGQNKTADNEQFVRQLWEVGCRKVGTNVKWLPYAKGGGFRKWAGNITNAVNWSPEARAHYRKSSRCRIVPEYLWYRPGVTWSRVASAGAPNGFRILPSDSTFDMVGSSIFLRDDADISTVLGILNTGAASFLLQMLNPTVDLQVSDVRNLPFIVPAERASFDDRVARLVDLAQVDWDACEISWDFHSLSLLSATETTLALETSYTDWIKVNRETVAEMKRLEEENNRLFIEAYGLADELSLEVPLSQITLTVNPAYRYPGTKKHPLTEEQQWTRFRQDTMQELVSYAVGCMMGRYALDRPGLILANQGETLKDYLFRVSRLTEPLDEARTMADPDSVVFVEDAVARCSRCGTESTTDEGYFVLAPYEEREPARGRPLIYCAECVEDQSEHLGFQQSLHRFSARQAIDREWCEPETLATFLSSAGCFAHRVPMQKDDVTFLPDDDNVIPILDEGWFEDDITERFKVFLKTTFGADNYEENLTYLEDGLFPKNLEGGKRKTIRDYFLKEFYKIHVQYYKKRPIYWLFSSPKGAFQALIYLHRYRSDTVSVVRDKYLLEFKAKLTAKIEALAEQDTTAAKKEADKLKKKVKEMEDYDRDVLFPLAQKRIEIDLDDGVKVNYNKFGMALKKVTGLTGK